MFGSRFAEPAQPDDARCVALGFIGRLSVVLDSALLCITAADLAFSYVRRFGSSQRQERLSGFMAGIDAEMPSAREGDRLRRLNRK